ncbi:polyphenol oxidase YfiH [Gammaproteobacteria bacterium]
MRLDWLKPDWPTPPWVRALTTTRQGGVSRGPYAGLNLATHVGDDPVLVTHNRQWLHATLALPAEPQWLEQVHGTCAVDAGTPTDCPADASYAHRSGVVCAVLTADCLPVLFCDRDGTRVAAAHAGWRGLLAGVLEQTAAALAADPGTLMAWLGPAIGPTAFEVGEEVRATFLDTDAGATVAFRPSPSGRWLADIYQLARLRLTTIGLGAIHGGGLCTFSDPQRFYSYRRDGTCGRMASLIWLTPR